MKVIKVHLSSFWIGPASQSIPGVMTKLYKFQGAIVGMGIKPITSDAANIFYKCNLKTCALLNLTVSDVEIIMIYGLPQKLFLFK